MSDNNGRPSKRRKLADNDADVLSKVKQPDDIHAWLEFQQSTGLKVRSGLDNFNEYVAAVQQIDNPALEKKHLQILTEYCQWQKAPSDDQVDFYDLISTWSFAVDQNDEPVVAAVPLALTLFLRTISNSIDLRPFGLALIDTLLRRDQSKLFQKCLSSPKSKADLASPCLQLLVEMASFDAGSRATQLWYRRDLFIYKIEAALDGQKQNKDSEEQAKSSVREYGMRLLVTLLKYCDSTVKEELLFQARALHAHLRFLVSDDHEIVTETIDVFDKALLEDDALSPATIRRFFNTAHLENLADLYNRSFQGEDAKLREDLRQKIHGLLLKLCTTEKGILLPQHGWYPSTLKPHLSSSDDEYIDLGLDSPFYFDDYKDKIPVFNTCLSIFIQRLKPWEDVLQSSLLLKVLQCAPELVADYFSKRKQLPAANSDDEVWRGQFAFVFSVIGLPIPKHEGSNNDGNLSPPPLSIVVESIIPRPLDRTYLTKMLSAEDEVLRISAARVVTAILTKLRLVIDDFHKISSTNNYLWHQASRRLTELVESRLPIIRDVTLKLQHTATDDHNLRSALLESLLGYFNTIPHAESSTFDVGPFIESLCSQAVDTDTNIEPIIDQLYVCTQVAVSSPSTKWLHKANAESLSPVTMLLKVCVELRQNSSTQNLLHIIKRVLVEKGIMLDSPSTFNAVCASLTPHKKFTVATELFSFFDNCMVRTAQKPVKYLDDIEEASQIVSDRKPLSLVVAAIAEQWNFALKRHEDKKSIIKNIAAWVAQLFSLLDTAGENYRIILHFQEHMLKEASGKHREYLQDAISKVRKKPPTFDEILKAEDKPATLHNGDTDIIMHEPKDPLEPLRNISSKFIPIPDSLEGLDKWPPNFDLEFEMNTQRLQRLILCISAADQEIRIQAHQTLQHLLYSTETTLTHESKQQIFLILGELNETITQHGQTQPLPTLIPELANALLAIALQPTNFMFARANKFLLHKPSWPAKGVVLYWLEHILRHQPDSDDDTAWNEERSWLLQLFVAGLRTEVDLELYRRSNLWEHVLSLYASPCLAQENRRLVLALVLQALEIEGGADMLWTRFGVNSWLGLMEKVDRENEECLGMLREKMEERCDRGMIEKWKNGNSLSRKGVVDE